MSHVEEIKERLDIVQVVSSYIKLDKAGANYKARCPFHNEKTPSFFVSPERGSFYCFGCGAKGDILTFVEKFEGLDFMGALQVLAGRAGVKLEKTTSQKENRKEILYEILETATRFFQDELSKSETAKNYILGRGLSLKTLENFRIGYAQNDWRTLRNHLKAKGFRDADVLAVGLIKKTEKAASDPYYDVFRGRIIFPIGDTSGRTVAFSGRIVEDDGKSPKYLNSPETVLYSKSKTLYGLDKAKMDIRRRGYSILVEGQMDLVMSHQAGFTNTVASSGTAFTEDRGTDSAFGFLTRLSDNIVVAFDSDAAGQKAVRRIVPALSLGMNVKIVDIKGGKDPADIIKVNPKDWTKILESKKDFMDYLLDVLIDSRASPAAVLKQVRQDIFPYIMAMPMETSRAQAVKKIAEKLAIREDALWKDLQEYMKQNQSKGLASVAHAEIHRVGKLESIERKLAGLLYSKKYWNGDEKKKKELEEIKKIENLSSDDVAGLTLEAEVTYGDIDAEKEWRTLLLHLEGEIAKEKLETVMISLHKAEKANALTEDMIKEIKKLTERIQQIKNLTALL